MTDLRFLRIQIREPDDPMRPQEIRCFAEAIDCRPGAIQSLDLLVDRLRESQLQSVDAVLIGGSGEYSAAANNPWLEQTLADLHLLYDLRKPTFASCWGFQALAKALGGDCIHDPAHAELGTLELHLTDAGQEDLLFGALGSPFFGQAGHEDHVVQLPPSAVLLASSDAVTNQAFRLADAPIYCTQFHPELDRETLLDRLSAYPQYVQRIAGQTVEEFARHCHDTPDTRRLLQRFAHLVSEAKL